MPDRKRAKAEPVIADADVLVDSLKTHVSFDGKYRVPGSTVSRYVIPKGKTIPRHVIVIESEQIQQPETAADEPKQIAFKELKSAQQLKEIAKCQDAEQLTEWGLEINESSRAYKAIADRILELELGGN